ncbi:MAG: glycosyltransferase [Bacteroidales bacterium]
MNVWITLVQGGAILICFAYVALIILFTIGWFRLRYTEFSTAPGIATVTVVIAARNEEENIGICLAAIISQDYPRSLFGIIVVDDHSTDGTLMVINRVIEGNPGINIRLLQLTAEEQGKKTAISKAIAVAQNEWIVTTDADCVMGANWLSSLMAGAVDPEVQMLLAPVIFRKTKTVFGQMQELEFLSLIASSAGAVSTGLPVMCNGANLAYRREAFFKAGGYTSDKGFASGDDVFLMMKIRQMYNSRAIKFIKSPSSGVITYANETLYEFLNQRLRWVSKAKGYKDLWVLLVSGIVFTQSFLLLITTLAWATGFIKPILPLILFTAKFLADLPIMASACGFAKRRKLMIWYLPLQFIYPVYLVAMGMIGNILSFRWKGRKFR